MILVTGATGNVGRQVLDQLIAGGHPVSALSRSPQESVWPAEVDVVAGDLSDPASLDAALTGVASVFLFAVPGSGPAFVAAAQRAGVRRVVLLSSGGGDVHEADIAAVAVAALTEDGHAGQVYGLTGPQSLSHADQAEILGQALGRPISYAELPVETVRQAMSAHVPGPILDSIFAAWAGSVGRIAPTTSDIEKVTGRPARSYHDWVLDHAGAF